jgi:hypothetical protein
MMKPRSKPRSISSMSTKNDILNALKREPLTVAQLCERLVVTRNAINVQLKQLEAEGLARPRRSVQTGAPGQDAAPCRLWRCCGMAILQDRRNTEMLQHRSTLCYSTFGRREPYQCMSIDPRFLGMRTHQTDLEATAAAARRQRCRCAPAWSGFLTGPPSRGHEKICTTAYARDRLEPGGGTIPHLIWTGD